MLLLLYLLSQTCGGIVGQLTADVAAAPTRGVRGAHGLEVGWPLVRGRGEDADGGVDRSLQDYDGLWSTSIVIIHLSEARDQPHPPWAWQNTFQE